jgi:DNA replication initiation complex subunit (GINS family)
MNVTEKQIEKIVAANSLNTMITALLSMIEEEKEVYNDIENELSEFEYIRYSLKEFSTTLSNYCYDLNHQQE